MPRRRRLLTLVFALSAACTGPGGENDSDSATNTATATTTTTGGLSSTSSNESTTTDASTSAGTSSGSTSSGSTSADSTSSGSTSAGATSSGSTSTTCGDLPPLDDSACDGYATRYWDCCKAHCGWAGNVHPETDPITSCTKSDSSLGAAYDTPSSCQSLNEGSAFTCYSNNPWSVSPTLAYGFAAVPAQGDICGRCYQLEFTGEGHYSADDPGSKALKGKTMIVQATNIGHDVGGGQFDVLTPGGGVGLFDACTYQWGVQTSELGATYGGFMTFCQQQHPGDFAQQKQCLIGRCDAVFAADGLSELHAGCLWYVDWYEAADNPNLRYQEVLCPPELVAISGIDRSILGDVAGCGGGGGSCTQEQKDQCDCSWTNGGANCGQDDGSCCWSACCA